MKFSGVIVDVEYFKSVRILEFMVSFIIDVQLKTFEISESSKSFEYG